MGNPLRPKLLLATNNQAKVREYKSLLNNFDFNLVTLTDEGITTVVDEVGESLQENARLKASALANESHLIALADDSGLEVDALNGEPGRLSARYAGEGASDADRVNYLLSRLTDVPWEKRSACFKCVIAVAVPGREAEFCSGECQGLITFKPQGKYGFGYDPVFYLPELGRTMAEIPMALKNQVSHRGKAVRKAYCVLQNIRSNESNAREKDE